MDRDAERRDELAAELRGGRPLLMDDGRLVTLHGALDVDRIGRIGLHDAPARARTRDPA